MIRSRPVLMAVLAVGFAVVALTPAQAEFFGCNTPKVTHYTTYSSGQSYRAGSRHTYRAYTPAPRHYYSRTSHYSARSYRSGW